MTPSVKGSFFPALAARDRDTLKEWHSNVTRSYSSAYSSIPYLQLNEDEIVLHEVHVTPALWMGNNRPDRLDLSSWGLSAAAAPVGPSLAARAGGAAKKDPVQGVQGPTRDKKYVRIGEFRLGAFVHALYLV